MGFKTPPNSKVSGSMKTKFKKYKVSKNALVSKHYTFPITQSRPFRDSTPWSICKLYGFAIIRLKYFKILITWRVWNNSGSQGTRLMPLRPVSISWVNWLIWTSVAIEFVHSRKFSTLTDFPISKFSPFMTLTLAKIPSVTYVITKLMSCIIWETLQNLTLSQSVKKLKPLLNQPSWGRKCITTWESRPLREHFPH